MRMIRKGCNLRVLVIAIGLLLLANTATGTSLRKPLSAGIGEEKSRLEALKDKISSNISAVKYEATDDGVGFRLGNKRLLLDWKLYLPMHVFGECGSFSSTTEGHLLSRQYKFQGKEPLKEGMAGYTAKAKEMPDEEKLWEITDEYKHISRNKAIFMHPPAILQLIDMLRMLDETGQTIEVFTDTEDHCIDVLDLGNGKYFIFQGTHRAFLCFAKNKPVKARIYRIKPEASLFLRDLVTYELDGRNNYGTARKFLEYRMSEFGKISREKETVDLIKARGLTTIKLNLPARDPDLLQEMIKLFVQTPYLVERFIDFYELFKYIRRDFEIGESFSLDKIIRNVIGAEVYIDKGRKRDPDDPKSFLRFLERRGWIESSGNLHFTPTQHPLEKHPRFYLFEQGVSALVEDKRIFSEKIIPTIKKNWRGFFIKRLYPDFIEFFDIHPELDQRVPVILTAIKSVGDSLPNNVKKKIGKIEVDNYTDRMNFYEWISFRLLEYESCPDVLLSGSQQEIELWLQEEFKLMPVDEYDKWYRTYNADGQLIGKRISPLSFSTIQEFCRINGIDSNGDKAVDEFLRNFFNRKRKGLELAPGWESFFCHHLRTKYDADLTACDINWRALRVAKQDYGVPIRRGSITQLPFSDETFDYIIGISVLDFVIELGEEAGRDFRNFEIWHYINADRVASELYRVAKLDCVQLYHIGYTVRIELIKLFEDAGRLFKGDGGGFEIISGPEELLDSSDLFIKKVRHPLIYKRVPFWQIEKSPEKYFSTLVEALTDPDAKWTVKLRAIKALEKLKDPGAIDALVNVACGKTQHKSIAQTALDSIGNISKEIAEDVYLNIFLDEKAPKGIRIEALKNRAYYLTKEIPQKQNVLKILVKIIKKQDAGSGQKAISLIGYLGEDVALPELYKLYDWIKGLKKEEDGGFGRRYFLLIGFIDVLKTLGTDGAVDFIEKIVSDGEIGVGIRSNIPDALVSMGTSSALEALKRLTGAEYGEIGEIAKKKLDSVNFLTIGIKKIEKTMRGRKNLKEEI
ncbi:MAG: methyltransferase domain-containing protein [Candidatus Gorgyraea atricola]|nr:methyltransferase domain-containing protein [Candidatus Gorgyraea atricola]